MVVPPNIGQLQRNMTLVVPAVYGGEDSDVIALFHLMSIPLPHTGKSHQPDSHTTQISLASQTPIPEREFGQIPIRLLCCILSNRAPNEVGVNIMEPVLKSQAPLNCHMFQVTYQKGNGTPPSIRHQPN